MPSRSRIANHWKDKTLPNGESIMWDWYEPSCWACHKWWKVKEEPKLIEKGEFNKLWNHKGYKLQRCHIIPKMLGGSDDEGNLFLMCEKCHEDSPDTTNPDIFFNWVMSREQWNPLEDYYEFSSLMNKEIHKYNINIEDLTDFSLKDETQRRVFEMIGNHGFKIANSSKVYALVSCYLDYRKEGANG